MEGPYFWPREKELNLYAIHTRKSSVRRPNLTSVLVFFLGPGLFATCLQKRCNLQHQIFDNDDEEQ